MNSTCARQKESLSSDATDLVLMSVPQNTAVERRVT
jgi:hypothetical protein